MGAKHVRIGLYINCGKAGRTVEADTDATRCPACGGSLEGDERPVWGVSKAYTLPPTNVEENPPTTGTNGYCPGHY